jgi:hypothetical protein
MLSRKAEVTRATRVRTSALRLVDGLLGAIKEFAPKSHRRRETYAYVSRAQGLRGARVMTLNGPAQTMRTTFGTFRAQTAAKVARTVMVGASADDARPMSTEARIVGNNIVRLDN